MIFWGVLLYLLSYHLCQPQRHCSNAANPHPCISVIYHQQHPRCILLCGLAARGPQLAGCHPKGDTALIPSHSAGVQWCLFWFNICRTPPAIPPTDDNVSFITESEWVGFPSRADHHHIPPSIFLCRFSDIDGFHQKCLRQGMKQVHWDWVHNKSVVWRAKEAEEKWMKLRCTVPAYPRGPDLGRGQTRLKNPTWLWRDSLWWGWRWQS